MITGNKRHGIKYQREKRGKRIFLSFLTMLFVIICLGCSFAMNYILYQRVQSLTQRLEQLENGWITTEQE